MSKINVIVTDWLSLLRRILGQTEAGYGTLTLITQLPNRIDIVARQMATLVVFVKMHYKKQCKICTYMWAEDSEHPEPAWNCPYCDSPQITKFDYIIEAFHFKNMDTYNMYLMGFYSPDKPPYHRHYFITDIEDYFSYYNTLQWENLFDSLY